MGAEPRVRTRDALAGAWHFLLRLPAPWRPRVPWERVAGPATVWFPAVGALVGGAAAAALALAREPLGTGVAAALAVLVQVWLPGGLHADGLVDTADAWFGAADRQQALRIMKDPSAGALGVAALAGDLLLRWAALAELASRAGWAVPVAAGVASRWALAWAIDRHPYARAAGLGRAFKASMRPSHRWGATLLAAALLVPAGPPGWAAGGGGALVGVCLAAALARRFGGLTGDAYGAVAHTAETGALLTGLWVARW